MQEISYSYDLGLNYTNVELLNLTYMHNQCGVYLAESSIPNAGFGLYAGRDYEIGEILSDSYSILLTDIVEHNGDDGMMIGNSVFSDYGWICLSTNCYAETASFNEDFYMISNFGSWANYHPFEKNSIIPGMLGNEHAVDSRFEDFILDRRTSPGAGAITYYYDTHYASKAISAGDELFVDYGYDWAESRFKNFPKEHHFKKAQDVIKDIMTNYDEYLSNHLIFTNKTIYNELEFQLGYEKSRLHVADSLSGSLLPNNVHDMVYLYEKGITAIELRGKNRNIEWLEKNGRCVDNIRKGKSTIKDAGYGAFATRSIVKGDIVTTAPLLQIDRRLMKMKTVEIDEDGDVVFSKKYIGSQLMINYCFGHSETNILLCMLSNAGLINHKLPCRENDQNCAKSNVGPNAEFRWSSFDDTHEWLNLSAKEILQSSKRGISVDIVATRDIKVGEEVFMSYGAGWEAAWQKHVENWFRYQNEFENETKLSSINVTSKLIHTLSSYNDLELRCLWWETPLPDHYYYAEDDLETKIYKSDGRQFSNLNPSSYLGDYWPCYVIEFDQESDRYIVEIMEDPHQADPPFISEDSRLWLENFSFESMKIVKRAYSSDQHMKNSFRHNIEIPDAMLPISWKPRWGGKK